MDDTTSEWERRLFADGVNKFKFRNNRSLYDNCPQCRERFTQSNLPTLLVCGHFSCSECLTDTGCMICSLIDPDPRKIVKIKDYKQYFCRDVSRRNDNSLTYSFSITFMGNNMRYLKLNMPPTTNIGSLLQELPAFDTIHQVAKDETLVIINKQAKLYSQIKENQLQTLGDLLVPDGPSKQHNSILISNRNIGGSQL